jgi:LPXTG-site transpeptidase (sortase) family protein
MAAAGARLSIPRLGVDAQIVGIGVVDRTLDVPLDPKVLGWWTGSAQPGTGTGSVVIDGHVNYDGVAGALSVLPQLHVGDHVTLTRGTNRLSYRVTALRTYVKADGLPAEMFRQDIAERLVLVTCGGPFDAGTGNYEDNVVAYATPEFVAVAARR